MLHWYKNDDYQSSWLTAIKDILNDNELGYIWQTQDIGINQGFVKSKVKERFIHTRFIQHWKAAMFHSSKRSLYKEIYNEFGIKPHLYNGFHF